MGSYIANFTVYTMAMLGLIFFAIFVYKKFMEGGLSNKNSKYLSIEETMPINPRKSLLIVRAGNERFLVASDMDRTTLLSKLDSEQPQRQTQKDFRRFENIMTEELPQNINQEIEKLIPQTQTRLIDMDIVQNNKQPIHLEPIQAPNPEGAKLRRGMDRREQNNKTQTSNNQQVVLDFSKRQNKELTTIREMAKKINEL